LARTKPTAESDAALIATAQKQADEDKALLAAVQARDSQPAAPQQTVEDQFIDIANLIVRVKRETRLSEATLIKAWELNLNWLLANRQLAIQEQRTAPQFPFPTDESGTEPDGEGDTLPEPNEVLGGDSPSEE
jgi:hypothetical protein